MLISVTLVFFAFGHDLCSIMLLNDLYNAFHAFMYHKYVF